MISYSVLTSYLKSDLPFFGIHHRFVLLYFYMLTTHLNAIKNLINLSPQSSVKIDGVIIPAL